MNSNGLHRKHWFLVTAQGFLDAALFLIAHFLGVFIRFGWEDSGAVLQSHVASMLVGALAVGLSNYIFGLYSTNTASLSLFRRSVAVGSAVAIGVACSLPWNFITLTDFLGRGVTLISGGLAFALVLVHHAILVHQREHSRENVLYIVSCPFDEAETRLFDSIGLAHLHLAGLVEYEDYSSSLNLRTLGKVSDLLAIVRRERISRVLCTDKSLNDPALCKQFCQLRYSGVMVMPLITLCEEIDQCLPLELVTPMWLLNASSEPHMLYISKLKRVFDIIVSLAGIILSAPILILSIALIRLTSRGPALYRQIRTGRLGKPFEILKLRTMCVDAEKSGAVWCGGKDDPRVTFVGKFLRRYRFDEIPQLFNVLRGEMSFVGPRPERPEIIEKLAKEVPFYLERSLIQPGITGWAQVNYPYGSSVDDARRKLEYDLYYLKHMSVSLDIFILLDTVRIVLSGGVPHQVKLQTARHMALQQWERERAGVVASATPEPAEIGEVAEASVR